MSKILKTAGILIAMAISSIANADLVIIGNINYDAGQLDSDSVKKLFLGKHQSFPNGQKATPVNHAIGSPDRKEFFDTVLVMDESNYKRHWSRMIATGKGASPIELSSYEDVLHWVAENPYAIAYVDSQAINKSVKVLLTIEDFSDLSNTDVSEAHLSEKENI